MELDFQTCSFFDRHLIYFVSIESNIIVREAKMVSQLNSVEKNVFLALFENIVEHTPKVAEELSEMRPFSNNDEFLSAVGAVIGGLAHSEKVVSIFCVPFIIRNTQSDDDH